MSEIGHQITIKEQGYWTRVFAINIELQNAFHFFVTTIPRVPRLGDFSSSTGKSSMGNNSNSKKKPFTPLPSFYHPSPPHFSSQYPCPPEIQCP